MADVVGRYLIRDPACVVLDPIGGRGSSEVAASIGLAALEAALKESLDLVRAIEAANTAITTAAAAPRLRGMGSSVAALAVSGERATVAWVGDVQVARVRSGRFELLAPAHTLLAEYVKSKLLTRDEIESFPHPNVIVRALGMRATVVVDTVDATAEVGDVFALIDATVWAALGEAALTATLRIHGDRPCECVVAILEQVAAAGGQGTPTAVVVRIEPTGPVFAGGSGGGPGSEAVALRIAR